MWRHRGIFGVVLGTFTAGLMLGGTVSAVVTWVLGGLLAWVPSVATLPALLTIGIAILLNELRLVTLKLPANHRQVPSEIFVNGPYRSALQFGFELGTGVRTYLPSTVPYLLVGALLLLPASLPDALVSGASFGLGRAAMAISRTASPRSDTWDALLNGRLRLVQPMAAVIGMVVCTMLAWHV